jgi:hypothetical protein
VKINVPILLLPVAVIISLRISKIDTNASSSPRVPFKFRCFNSAIQVITFTYTYVIVEVSRPFNCVKQLDGSYSLANSPDLFCYDVSWWKNVPFVVFYLIVYGAAVPLLLVLTLRRFNLNPGDPYMTYVVSPLTSLFDRKLFFWEMVVLLRKVGIALAANMFASLMSTLTRSFVLLIVLLGFCTIDIVFNPYSTVFSNKINTL